jgi:hypothetical protein
MGTLTNDQNSVLKGLLAFEIGVYCLLIIFTFYVTWVFLIKGKFYK